MSFAIIGPRKSLNAIYGSMGGILCLLALMVIGAPVNLQAQITFTGGGSRTPVGASSALSGPEGVAVDPSGTIYVADTGNNRLVAVNSTGTRVVTTALLAPRALAADAKGDIFIADTGNNRVLKYTPGVGIVTVAQSLDNPWGVAVDAAGDVFIADTYNYRVLKETPLGTGYKQTVVATTTYNPFGITVDQQGNVYLADYFNGSLYQEYPVGSNYEEAKLLGGLNEPIGLTVDGNGNVFISQSGDGVITECVMGLGSVLYTVGITTPTLSSPVGLWSDPNGSLYIADSGDKQIALVQTSSVGYGRQSVLPPGSLVTPFTQVINVLIAPNSNATASVVTTGAAGLDFHSSGESCQVWPPDNSYYQCQLLITFVPSAPGVRRGAVVYTDSQGNELLNVPIYGVGVAPQTVFDANAGDVPKPLASSLTRPYFIAVDAAGNTYTSQQTYGYVTKIDPSGTQTTVSSSFNSPAGVAVGGDGNLYVVDAPNPTGALYKLTPSGTKTTILNGINGPEGVAVDGAGNVFVAEAGTSSLLKVTPAGTVSIFATGLGFPWGVAVDATDNIYVSNSSGGIIYKITPTGVKTTFASGIDTPQGLAVDAAGNVYLAGFYDGVFKFSPNGTKTTLVPDDFSVYYLGIAADGKGNVSLSAEGGAAGTGQVSILNRATPPAIAFAQTAGGSTSSDSPQAVMVGNAGNSALNFSSLVYPKDFPEAEGGMSPCVANTVLAPSVECALPINFSPVYVSGTKTTIPLSESITFKTNAMNITANQQKVVVSGTETKLAAKASFGSLTATVRLGSFTTPKVIVSPVVAGGPVPTGTVGFYSNGTSLGAPVALINGVAAEPFTPSALGTDTITATYYGGPDYAQAPVSASEKVTVIAKASTTITVSSSSNPSTHGVSVTFTAKVGETIAGTLPTGTVKFYSDGTLIGSGTLSSSQATFATSTLTAATHSITAVYEGDSNYSTVTSAALSQKVNP